MYSRVIIYTAVAAAFLLSTTGCVTSSEPNGGWVVVGQPETTQPPPPSNTKKPGKAKNNSGQERAARNHMRNAYRFLQKGKPDHALRELEKARRQMEGNFWFHYYMGGSYYFKGMYKTARDNWQIAYRSTKNHRLRSRLRTCQSFAAFHLEGNKKSLDLLRKAMDLDRENHQARELYRDLVRVEGEQADGRQEVQVGFMKRSDSDPELDRSRPGVSPGMDKPDEVDDGRVWNDNEGNNIQNAKKKNKYKGKDRDHKKPKKKKRKLKIQDRGIFMSYYLIEME